MRKIIKIKFLRGAHGTSGPTRQLRPLGELCYERLMLRGGGQISAQTCVCVFLFQLFFYSSSNSMKQYFWIELLIVWKISMLFYVVGVVLNKRNSHMLNTTHTHHISHHLSHTLRLMFIIFFLWLFSFVMGG